MAKQTYYYTVISEVEVVFDPDVEGPKVLNDDWASSFYTWSTPEEIAKHFAYNRVANDVYDVNRLDGWADGGHDVELRVNEVYVDD